MLHIARIASQYGMDPAKYGDISAIAGKLVDIVGTAPR